MNKKKFTGLVLLLFLFTLNACVSTNNIRDIKVTQYTSNKVNMRGYKTYAPLFEGGYLEDSQGTWVPRNMDINAEIQALTKAQLDRRGKSQVLVNPDFYVGYVVGVDIDSLKEKVNRKGQSELVNIPSTGLAIMFIDANNGDLIWMSVAEGDLKENLSTEAIKKRISYAINKMFKHI